VYIVAIVWHYVVIMMAVTEPGLMSGAMTFLCYGILPLGLFLWILGTPSADARPPQSTPLAKNRTSAIEPIPSEINTTCSRVARSSGRRCRPGIRSATET
jgi:hypothetical protein